VRHAACDVADSVIPIDRGGRRVGLGHIKHRADEHQLPGLGQATEAESLGDAERSFLSRDPRTMAASSSSTKSRSGSETGLAVEHSFAIVTRLAERPLVSSTPYASMH
jgi:hypothetical protein